VILPLLLFFNFLLFTFYFLLLPFYFLLSVQCRTRRTMASPSNTAPRNATRYAGMLLGESLTDCRISWFGPASAAAGQAAVAASTAAHLIIRLAISVLTRVGQPPSAVRFSFLFFTFTF
jgi:hypothetical protein